MDSTLITCLKPYTYVIAWISFAIKQSCDCSCTNVDTLERQDLPCSYLAHHEPESVIVVIINCRMTIGGGEDLSVQDVLAKGDMGPLW